jgi:hypothetical protein
MDYSPYLHAGDILKQGVVASLPSSGECAKVGPFPIRESLYSNYLSFHSSQSLHIMKFQQ